MLKKGDLKLVGLMMVGVIGAGLVFSQFGDAPVISQARNGFDY